jgi:hypothetical protein
MPGFEPVATSVIVSAGRVDKIELFLKATESAASAPVQTMTPPPKKEPASASAPIELKTQTPASAPVAVTAPAKSKTRAAVHPGLAWMPLGIAQFLEQRHLAGGLLLAAELLLAAVSTTTFALILADRLPSGAFNNAERNRSLQIVNLTSAGALLITAVVGAVDGELHREAP